MALFSLQFDKLSSGCCWGNPLLPGAHESNSLNRREMKSRCRNGAPPSVLPVNTTRQARVHVPLPLAQREALQISGTSRLRHLRFSSHRFEASVLAQGWLEKHRPSRYVQTPGLRNWYGVSLEQASPTFSRLSTWRCRGFLFQWESAKFSFEQDTDYWISVGRCEIVFVFCSVFEQHGPQKPQYNSKWWHSRSGTRFSSLYTHTVWGHLLISALNSHTTFMK